MGSGGKNKKQTVGYFYDKDLHGVLCHSPVDAITRIECDDREIARSEISETGNFYINKPNIFGGKDKEGGIQGNIDVLFGREDQQQNSYMVGKLGEYLPSYRGVLSIVFKKLYVGMSPYLRSFKFRIRKTSVGWYPEKSEINIFSDIDDIVDRKSGDFYKYSVIDGFPNEYDLSQYARIELNDDEWVSSKGGFGSDQGYNTRVDPAYGRCIMIRDKFTIKNFERFNNLTVTVRHDDLGYLFVNGVRHNLTYIGNSTSTATIPKDSLVLGDNLVFSAAIDTSSSGGGTSNIYLSLAYKTNYSTVYDCDINPAHIIYDLLSNKIYGKGAPDSKIDLDALEKMADTLYNERMGISLVWGESSSYEDFMNLVCDHIKAVVPYVDVQTGKWTTKLLRDDYSKPALVHLNESNIQSVKNFTRKTMSDAVNVVTVTYWDRKQGKTSTISVDNPARVAQQGKTITQKIDYDGFTNSEIASRVALRELKTLSSFLASVTLQAFGDQAMSLKVGDCFRWSWGDFRISEAVMRVTKVNYGGVLTNYATIDAIEDSFSTPNEAVVPYLPPNEQDSEEPKQADFLAMEAPYFDVVQMFGETEVNSTLEANPDIGYTLVSADRPQTNALNATLLTSLSNDFEDVGAVDFAPTARLVEDIDKITQSFLIKNIENLSEASTNTLIQVNDETMAYVSYDLSTSTLTVKRGVHDTTVHNHPADSIIYFWDEYASYDQTQQIDGTIVNVKVLTNTGRDILNESFATTKQVEFNSRAIRPYPPANVKINGEYFPKDFIGDLTLTWVDRNRLQQTGGEILGFYDSGVTIEENVEYVAELYDGGNVLISSTNIGVVNTATVDYSTVTTSTCKVKLYSIRDGYKSTQAFEHEMIVGFLPPYNVQANWNNTTQSVDLTWEFDE